MKNTTENSESTGERRLFKDYFDQNAARALADQLRTVWPKFDRRAFVRNATKGLEALEFAGRVQRFSDALAETLPDDIPRALALLTESLPPPLPNCDSVTDGWLQWPVGQFIADHGVPHFDASMTAMIALTQRFSSEFAVRPFVEQHPEPTFARLVALTAHDSPHVRRWCSEGVRPRLPWGKRLAALVANPGPIWPILEALKDDPELYVRRSVANNLNDIAKDHPDAVVKRAKNWSCGADDNRAWLVKHALRSLVKAGHPGALHVIGFAPPKQLRAVLSVQPRKPMIGSSVVLTATLISTLGRQQDLLVDYVVHFAKKSGQTGGKVFKWTTATLPARGKETIEKKHAFRETTVRALYPGTHRIELQVNGVIVAESAVELRAR